MKHQNCKQSKGSTKGWNFSCHCNTEIPEALLSIQSPKHMGSQYWAHWLWSALEHVPSVNLSRQSADFSVKGFHQQSFRTHFAAYFISKDTSKFFRKNSSQWTSFEIAKLQKKGSLLLLDCKQMFARKYFYCYTNYPFFLGMRICSGFHWQQPAALMLLLVVSGNFITEFHRRGVVSVGTVRNTHSPWDWLGGKKRICLHHCTAATSSLFILDTVQHQSHAVLGSLRHCMVSDCTGSISSSVVNFLHNHICNFCFSWYIIFDIWKWNTIQNIPITYRSAVPQLIARCSDFKAWSLIFLCIDLLGKGNYAAGISCVQHTETELASAPPKLMAFSRLNPILSAVIQNTSQTNEDRPLGLLSGNCPNAPSCFCIKACFQQLTQLQFEPLTEQFPDAFRSCWMFLFAF